MAAARLGTVDSLRALLGGVMSYGQAESHLHHRNPPDSWMELAACKGLNPESFHPLRGDHQTVAYAKAVCAACPVRAECLEHALVNRETRGVWGGLTERGRRRIRRQRAALAAR